VRDGEGGLVLWDRGRAGGVVCVDLVGGLEEILGGALTCGSAVLYILPFVLEPGTDLLYFPVNGGVSNESCGGRERVLTSRAGGRGGCGVPLRDWS
jgi:hypothetical protein